jgi:tRNA G10  N-methylase Trm11
MANLDTNIIYTGSAEWVLKAFPDNFIDTVITDPPYGLSNHSEKVIRKVFSEWLSGNDSYIPDNINKRLQIPNNEKPFQIQKNIIKHSNSIK